MVTPAPAAASSGTPSELSDDGRTAPTPRTRAHTPTSPAIRSAGIDVGRLAVWSMRSKVTSPMGAVGEAKATKGKGDVRARASGRRYGTSNRKRGVSGKSVSVRVDHGGG